MVNIMEPIYTFNGQDITMVICLLIRDVVNEIQKRSYLSFDDAVDTFYASATYTTLQNTEMLFGQNQQALSRICIP